MTASLRALLEGAIDYAGLFPPAQLPLDQAFSAYLRYRREAESWMLGRFIIPASRLTELTPFLNQVDARVPLSALGRGEAQIADDLNAMSLAEKTFSPRLRCDAIELKVSGDAIAEKGPTLIPTLGRLIAAREVAAFFEISLSADWRQSVRDHVQACLAATQSKVPAPGLKLRCGGQEASAYPTPEQVAYILTTCRDALIPLKFTAGLHHPLRHYNNGAQTKMHGFLNIFAAGVLAHRHHLSEEEVRAIIEDEDGSHFRFDDHGFRWRDYAASLGEIRLARQLAVTSFGSCSFDEPRADLKTLGLLQVSTQARG